MANAAVPSKLVRLVSALFAEAIAAFMAVAWALAETWLLANVVAAKLMVASAVCTAVLLLVRVVKAVLRVLCAGTASIVSAKIPFAVKVALAMVA